MYGDSTMSYDEIKEAKHHIKEALRVLENLEKPPKEKKKANAKISPKKENPQNTASGISWSYQGNMVLFKVPYKLRHGFKKIIKDKSTELAKWDKDMKVWKLHEDHVTADLLDTLIHTHTEWLEAQEDEYKP